MLWLKLKRDREIDMQRASKLWLKPCGQWRRAKATLAGSFPRRVALAKMEAYRASVANYWLTAAN